MLGTSVSPCRPPTCPTSGRRPAQLPAIPGQRTLWTKPVPATLQETFSTPRETRRGRLTFRRPAIRLEHNVAGSPWLPYLRVSESVWFTLRDASLCRKVATPRMPLSFQSNSHPIKLPRSHHTESHSPPSTRGGQRQPAPTQWYASWPPLTIEALGKIQLVDVVLPTHDGREIRRRCITRPTDHQAILLQRLHLNLPNTPQTGCM